MKRFFSVSVAVAILMGTAMVLLQKERRSISLQEQLQADRAFNVQDSLKVGASSLAKPVLPDASVTPAVDFSAVPEDPNQYREKAPLSPKEIAGARALVSTFFREAKGREGLNHLIRDLQTAGLQPEIAKESASDGAGVITVKAKGMLEGTRALRARYHEKGGADQELVRNHLSFEVRASPNAISVVKNLLETAAGRRLGRPDNLSPDKRMEWKMEGQRITVQRLSRSEIDPNAGADFGVGAVRVVMEPETDTLSH